RSLCCLIFSCLCALAPHVPHCSPTRRSSDLKSHKDMSRYSLLLAEHILEVSGVERDAAIDEAFAINEKWQAGEATFHEARQVALDRKSTRLNSSHVKISYAVFCLKKKKTSTS